MDELTVLYVAGDDGPDPPPPLTDRPDASVARADTAAAALDRVEESPPDCVVTAYHLPDDTGAALTAAIRSLVADLPVVLYSDADRTTVRSDDATTVVEFVDASAASADRRLVQLLSVATEQRCHAPYPLPDDEAGRSAALPTVDGDGRVGEALDRLARLAALHFDAPYAAVNVVDDRVVTALGQYGDAPREFPRDASACTYTILAEGPTVIPDMASDPRFISKTAVTDLGLGFYAGAPIDVDGWPVGTVCVYDTERRDEAVDGDDELFLETLAAAAREWLATPPARASEGAATAGGRSE